MLHLLLSPTLVLFVVTLVVAGCVPGNAPVEEPMSTSYDDLTALFEEWRGFEKPEFSNGVPDYTAGAMANQHRDLAGFQRRLEAIDPSGWPVSQQVNHHIVRAEMNGLDFYHRVSRPWAQNPAFYVTIFPSQSDVPAREGPVIHGSIDLWTYEYPLGSESATELTAHIGAIPSLLEQARGNLVEDAKDLWVMGIRSMRSQSSDLQTLGERVAGTSAELDAAIESAREATDEFAAWLEVEAPSKTGTSGVGVDNFNWYMRNVHLVPLTWEEQMLVIRRELARSRSTLLLEEHRNRSLPEQERISNAEDYDRHFNAAVTEYIEFLEKNEIFSVRDYDGPALRKRIGRFTPADGLRGFFSEVSYRDPMTMRTHGHHWFDLAMMAREPHPSSIRSVPSLYNIFDSRAEGMATGMEEWMMHAGLFDENPRSRELILILVAQRAARAVGGLMMHANKWTIDEAVEFAAKWTPRGYMPADSNTVWHEQHFYLTQPGYSTSYLIGKCQIEELMSERALQLGADFTINVFMDDIHASGLIPMSLIRWEMTGQKDEILEASSIK